MHTLSLSLSLSLSLFRKEKGNERWVIITLTIIARMLLQHPRIWLLYGTQDISPSSSLTFAGNTCEKWGVKNLASVVYVQHFVCSLWHGAPIVLIAMYTIAPDARLRRVAFFLSQMLRMRKSLRNKFRECSYHLLQKQRKKYTL
jgi:hypothetical protein